MKHKMSRNESKHMSSKTGIDRLSGVLLLLALVTSFVAAGLASGVGEYNVAPDEVGDTLRRVADNQGLHQAEIGFDLASYVLTVALAGALYLAFSPHNQPLALLGSLGLAAGGLILAVHDIPWFVLPSVAGDFVSASGAEVVALQNTGRVVMLTANWGLSVGVTFQGLGALAYQPRQLKPEKLSAWLRGGGRDATKPEPLPRGTRRGSGLSASIVSNSTKKCVKGGKL